MGLLLGLHTDFNGFWLVDETVDDTAICWIRVTAGENVYQINYRPWILLYIPLIIVYVYSIYVLSCAYSHLRRGISKTFQHRVKVLVQNSINIGIYMGYWAFLLFLYACSYIFVSDANSAQWFWKCLLFGISSKGFADLLVFILVSDANPYEGDIVKSNDPMDLNAALRQEVLYYATTGIRECASQHCIDINREKIVIKMSQTSGIETQDVLTINNLIKLVFSGEKNVTDVSDYVLPTHTNITHVEEGDSEFSRQSLGGNSNVSESDRVSALSMAFNNKGSSQANGSRPKSGNFMTKSRIYCKYVLLTSSLNMLCYRYSDCTCSYESNITSK
jgi:hypothetical protein